jgi:hypothetical protein
MFKNVIAPIQAWLLASGKCVACGQLLNKGKKIDNGGETEKIICKCGRIYIFDKKTKKYRRALTREV